MFSMVSIRALAPIFLVIFGIQEGLGSTNPTDVDFSEIKFDGNPIKFSSLNMMDLVQPAFFSINRIPFKDFIVSVTPISMCNVVHVVFHKSIEGLTSIPFDAIKDIKYTIPTQTVEISSSPTKKWDRSFLQFKYVDKDNLALLVFDKFSGYHDEDRKEKIETINIKIPDLKDVRVTVLTNSRYCHASVSYPGISLVNTYPTTVDSTKTNMYLLAPEEPGRKRDNFIPRVYNSVFSKVATVKPLKDSKKPCLPQYHSPVFASSIAEQEWGISDDKLVVYEYDLRHDSPLPDTVTVGSNPEPNPIKNLKSLNVVYRDCEFVSVVFVGNGKEKQIDLVLGYNFFVPPMSNRASEFSYNMKALSRVRIQFDIYNNSNDHHPASLSYFEASSEAMAYRDTFDFGDNIEQYNKVYLIRAPSCMAALLEDRSILNRKNQIRIVSCESKLADISDK